ncbi:Transcriptional repressor CTCF [Nymphon striatum]|nr:Transcriptional repressor CTCF [Nymphon striatum]
MESENNRDKTEAMETESINEIQTYLESFNKEIQTGSNAQQRATASHPPRVQQAPTNIAQNSSQPSTETTYFVTSQPSGDTQVSFAAGYEESQVQNQFSETGGEEATYYPESGEQSATYYVATNDSNQPQQTEYIQSYSTDKASRQEIDNSTVLESDNQTIIASNEVNQNGLQQIVLAASQAEPVPTSSEPMDTGGGHISVSIPASLLESAVNEIISAGEKVLCCLYGGSTDEGLDALRYKRFKEKVSTRSSSAQVHTLPPTAAASARYHSTRVYLQVQQWIGKCSNLNPEEWGWRRVEDRLEPDELIPEMQPSEESEQQSTSQSEPQTIRMIVQQPDGTEQGQPVSVSALRSAAAAQGAGGSGTTLMTADGQEITIAPTGSNANTSSTTTLMTSDGQQFTLGGEETLQMMANIAEQTSNAGENSQVILDSGNAYQTVTIVPSSETNQNEVSYVLIVSQDDGKDGNKDNVDMSVYDFTEGAGDKSAGISIHEAHSGDTNNHDIVTFTTKVTPKKSQVVSQATHMCNYCNYTSPKRYLLSRHMKSHSEERPHKCSVCERGFKTLSSLQNHVNTHTGTRPHQCKECPSAFTTSGELVRHVRYKHTHEKPHKCTECDYASVELSKLKRHMRCHTGERPYQCPHCTYASPDTYKLKRHLRIHTGSEKPYVCEECDAKFTQSNSLKAHRLIHTGNKPIFKCELCPTTCGRKTDLRIHVQKLHTADKPLKCKRCIQIFPDRYSYKQHVKTHEGEKCFKCDLCQYASISQRHLESHMLIHTDQKPFICEECEQCFRQKQLLKRHKNLYHNPNYVPPVPKDKSHECPDCGKAFRHKGNLIRHMAIHDPEATAAEKAEAVRYGRRTLSVKQGMQLATVDSLGQVHEVPIQTGLADGSEGPEGSVVVFEVIQLPGSGEHGEISAGTILDENSEIVGNTISSIQMQNQCNISVRMSEINESHELVEPDLESMKRKTTVSSNLGDDFEWNCPSDSENRDPEENSEDGRQKLACNESSDVLIVTEHDVQQQRAEQKQKDVEECFGFNDEEDDGETPRHPLPAKTVHDINAAFDQTLAHTETRQIMNDEQAMREIAEVVGNNGGASSTYIVTTQGVGDANAAETAIQLLAAMQEHNKTKPTANSQ